MTAPRKAPALHPLEREFRRVRLTLAREGDRHTLAHGCSQVYVTDEWSSAALLLRRDAITVRNPCTVHQALTHAWCAAFEMEKAIAWLTRGEFPPEQNAKEWGIDKATNAIPPDPDDRLLAAGAPS